MQRTRLSTLVSTLGNQFDQWLVNPWRRLSIVVISLLFGYFFGVAIAAIAGQAAEQDVVVSAILVVIAEVISRVVYGRQRNTSETSRTWPLFFEALNSIKIGATYALCVEAFKLGS